LFVGGASDLLFTTQKQIDDLKGSHGRLEAPFAVFTDKPKLAYLFEALDLYQGNTLDDYNSQLNSGQIGYAMLRRFEGRVALQMISALSEKFDFERLSKKPTESYFGFGAALHKPS